MVESILGLGDAWVGSVSGKVCWELQNRHRKLQNFTKICKCFIGIYKFRWNLLWFGQIRLNPTRLGQDLVGFGWDLARSCRIWPNFVYSFIWVGSGGLSFGEGNAPLDLPVLILEKGDPLPTYGSFSLGWNWVDVRRFS